MKSGGGFMRLLSTVLVLAMAAWLGAWGFAALDRFLGTARVDECSLDDGSRALMLPEDALLADSDGGYYVRLLVAGRETDCPLTVLEIRDGFVIAALEEDPDALRPGSTVILDIPDT